MRAQAPPAGRPRGANYPGRSSRKRGLALRIPGSRIGNGPPRAGNASTRNISVRANRSSGDDAPAEAAPPRPNVPAGIWGHAGDVESRGEVDVPLTAKGCAAAGDSAPVLASANGGASARREAGVFQTEWCAASTALTSDAACPRAFRGVERVTETGSADRAAGCAGVLGEVGAVGAVVGFTDGVCASTVAAGVCTDAAATGSAAGVAGAAACAEAPVAGATDA